MLSYPSKVRHRPVHIRSFDVHLPPPLLQLRPTICVSLYMFFFFQSPALLTTGLSVPPQTIYLVGIFPLPINIHGVPLHTSTAFGALPQDLLFGVPSTPHRSRHTSPLASRQHLRFRFFPPFPTWNQHKYTSPYSNFSRFI